MNFICIESFDYAKDENFTHRVQVIQRKGPSHTEFYVNLRIFENGFPTDNGICLHKAEFEKLLPFLEKKENTVIRNGRIVKFLKLDKFDTQFYELLLFKTNSEFQVMI